MRELLQRVIALSAVLTGAVVAGINVMNDTPWPLALTRAAIALGIVLFAGTVIGFVLMRTALRRHYEAWLIQSRRPRAGAGR